VTQQPPEASRIVEEAAIRILDELAVEGGRGLRAHLFDKCQVMLWGHVVNVAARRAGYTGHNDAEIERHGKEQLFVEAMNLLLERQQIVVWDESGNLIALHPTHRGDYIPGTNLWRSQRQTVLNELREQLMQFRVGKIIGDQSFEATLQKAITLYAQQLRRGQLAGDTREDALGELLGLADVLFDPAKLAPVLGVDESEVRAVAARRLQPTPPAAPPKRKHTRVPVEPVEAPVEPPVDPVEPEEPAVEPPAESVESLETGADIRRARTRRGWLLADLGDRLGVSKSAVGKWETGRETAPAYRLVELRAVFAKYPVPNGTVS